MRVKCGRYKASVEAVGTTSRARVRDAVDLLAHGQYAVSDLAGIRTRPWNRIMKRSSLWIAGLLLVVLVSLKPIRHVFSFTQKTPNDPV